MEERSVNLRELTGIIRRHWKMICYTWTIAIFAALMVNLFMTPQYESTVSLRVVEPQITINNGVAAEPKDIKEEINTYSEIVKSRAVVEQAIKKMYGNNANRPGYDDVVNLIETRPVRTTSIFRVSTRANSPEEAQLFANELLSAFNQHLTSIERSSGRETRIFISERLAATKKDLGIAEKVLVDYQQKNKTVELSEDAKSFLDRQTDLGKLRIENKMNLDAAQSKYSSVDKQLGSASPGFIAENPLIEQYKSKLADQEVDLVGLKKNYTENHPKVQTLEAAISETKSKLNGEIARVVNNQSSSSNPVYQNMLQNKLQAEVDVAVSQAQRNALDQTSADFDRELNSLPEKEQGLARAMRDYTLAEETYTMLAKRYEQARIDEVMQPTDIQVVDTANLPDYPARPRKGLNLLVGVVLGILAGIVLAFGSEFWFKTIDTTDDINKHLGLKVIGCVPGNDSSTIKGRVNHG